MIARKSKRWLRVMMLCAVIEAALLVQGCSGAKDATCPLPTHGVCAPIHVVDVTLPLNGGLMTFPAHLTTKRMNARGDRESTLFVTPTPHQVGGIA